jgi:metallo-beta-lactamase family protein
MKKSTECHSQSGIRVKTFGAAGGVTGSCYQVDMGNNGRLLLDCGLFQGRHEERSEEGERWNFSPVDNYAHGVNQILISHTHIDHTGRIPMVYKSGLTPRVLTTCTTADFLPTMLDNSAEIQEKENPQNRLYSQYDVNKTLRFVEGIVPFTRIPVGEKHSGVSAEFLTNGHVMGSASIFVRTPDGNILYTGDIGKPEQSLCGGYTEFADHFPNDPVHVLVTESTNADRDPFTFEQKQANLIGTIKEAWNKGGNPVLPILSFHRLQEIIEMLHNSLGTLLPSDTKIYVDAPLGVELLNVFKSLDPNQYSTRYGDDPNYYKTDAESLDRFSLPNVTFLFSQWDSINADIDLADNLDNVIVLASGGMGEHGRALNYIKGEFGQNPENTVIFTCFQVDGTQGAAMVHAKNINGKRMNGASIVKVEGFTSHASRGEIVDFLYRFNLEELKCVIIGHGRDPARQELARMLRARGYTANIVLPSFGQVIEV